MKEIYSPFEWLLIDLASQYGMDKDTYSERIQWSVSQLNLFKVDSLLELQSSLSELLAESDDKAAFMGVALALWDTYKGIPSSWEVAQDAASSGAQLMSCLMKCETGMAHTGVLGTKVPDLYTDVHTAMDTASIDRKTLKKGMIPYMYASEKAPKAVFGADYPKFISAYGACVPAAQRLSNILVDCWDSEATEYTWELPDGFEVYIPVINQNQKKIPYKNHRVEYRFNELGTIPKGKHGSKALSPNVIHSMDAYVLRELCRRCNYDPIALGRAIRSLESPKVGKACKAKAKKLKHLESLYREFKQVSVVAIEYITKETAACVSEEYRQELLNILYVMEEVKPFSVRHIH